MGEQEKSQLQRTEEGLQELLISVSADRLKDRPRQEVFELCMLAMRCREMLGETEMAIALSALCLTDHIVGTEAGK